MRGALIHGVLLAVMLVYGYRTWTRDKTVQPNVGSVVLWNKTEADLVSIEYRSPKKIVKLERKPEGYWWGADTTIEVKAKPPKPSDATGSAGSAAGSGSAGSAAGSAAGSGSAGSGAGSGSAAKPPEPPTIEEEETGRKTREFPIGDNGDKIIKAYAAARALRDLGKPNDAQKKDYKFGTKPTNIVTMKDGKDVSTTTITVTFKDGSRTFLVGGSVYGGSDKYVMDQSSGKAYVFAKDILTGLEVGESNLHLMDPRGFDATKINGVTLEAQGKSKSWVRITTAGADGKQQLKVWAEPGSKKADQTATNFIDNVNNLRPTEYASSIKIADLTPVYKITYREERGSVLGTLQLYRREKPGQLAEGQELDPANPPKGETEYYILTEKTRVPALVRKDTAQRSEQDLDAVFSGKQPEPKPVDPKGNPFGNMPPGHGAPPPGMPPGHGAPPGGAMTPPAPGMGPTGAPTGPKPPGAAPPGAAPTTAPGAKPAPGAGSAAPAGATKPAAPAGATKPAAPAPGATKPAPAAGTTNPAAPAAGSAAKPAAPTPSPAPPPPPAGSGHTGHAH